ncbi:MAG: hypothetical protein LC774_16760 [Acidobacteria bacterium]|nr:hypothetical protein [Acidobacteriota bacterium]
MKVAVVALDRDQDEPSTVIEDVLVEDKRFKALIDTTQEGTLALTPAAVKLLGQIAPDPKSPPREGSVRELKIGGLARGSTRAVFFGKGAGLDHSLKKYGVIIGNGLMEKFIVTLDYRKNVVTLVER